MMRQDERNERRVGKVILKTLKLRRRQIEDDKSDTDKDNNDTLNRTLPPDFLLIHLSGGVVTCLK